MDELLLINDRERTPLEPYKAEEKVPEEFLNKWNNKNIYALPSRFSYRRNLCMDLIDGHHRKSCMSEEYHIHSLENCLCQMCGYKMKWYHTCEDFDHPLLLYLDSIHI